MRVMRAGRKSDVLQRAAEVLGGRDRLAIFLTVSLDCVHNWLAGREDPPFDVLVVAQDVLIE
jgi:hypothetical protein